MGSGASSVSASSSTERFGATSSDRHSDQYLTRRVSKPNASTQRKELLVPGPFPPRTRKAEMFKDKDYKHVDDYVSQMPQELNYGTFRDLVEYLTSPDDWDDISKVRAIYRWVTSVDVFSAQVSRKPPSFSPMEYFLKIQNNTGNHAYLMAGVCQLAGIPCAIVDGINKSAAYEIGKRLNKQSMKAQWNAAYVGGSWRFIDAFWASSCVVGRKTGEWTLADSRDDFRDEDDDEDEGETQHRINEFYFFPDPDEFIWTHFPKDSSWQLLEEPATLEEFENHFYVRERFHVLGMTVVPTTKSGCVVETEDGETEICFGLPRERSSDFRFRHVLYRSRRDAKETKLDLFFDRFVIYEKEDDFVRFTLRFPVTGIFKLDIYGMDVGDGDMFDLCCTYIIICRQAKQNCLPLPDCPEVGWGPQADTTAAGVTPLTHKKMEILSNNGLVEIELNKERDIALYHILKHSLLDEATLSKYSVAELKDNKAIVYLRLPQKGEYALKLYAQEVNEDGPTQNILNYLVNCSSTDEDSRPFPNVCTGLLGREFINSNIFGIEAVSHTGAYLSAENGEISLDFRTGKDVKLICEMHTTIREVARHMSHRTTNNGQRWNFQLDMPVKGEYSCNIFARDKEQGDVIHIVQSYLINSDGHNYINADKTNDIDTSVPTETIDTSDDEVTIPVPSNCNNPVAAISRRNGYDPPEAHKVQFFTEDGVNMVKVSLTNYGKYMLSFYDMEEVENKIRIVAKYQINKKRPGEVYNDNINSILQEVYTDNNGSVEQDVSTNNDKRSMVQEVYTDNKDSSMVQEVYTDNKDSSIVQEVYTENKDSSIVQEVYTNNDSSVIEEIKPESGPSTNLDEEDNSEERAREHARKNMQKALDLNDVRLLEQAVKNFIALGGDESDPLLKRAMQQIEALKSKLELMEATRSRDLKVLEKAIARGKNANVNHEVDVQLSLAQRLRDHLVKMEKLRHAVLDMEPKTIAEIKSYANPPDGVHQCLIATFLLLGHQLKEVKVWQRVQALLGKTGKESVIRKISNFDAKKTPLQRAEIAKKIIQPYNKDQIRDVSAGAATFYIWAVGMIEEVRSCGGAERTNHLRLMK